MTQSAVCLTHIDDSSEAGTFLGSRILQELSAQSPDAVILFASSKYDHEKLLAAITASCKPGVLIGCSSAGEFTQLAHGAGSAVAIGLRSSTMKFSVSAGRGLRKNVDEAARQIVSSLSPSVSDEYPYRSAMILTDALAGQAERIIDQITTLGSGGHQLFGGGAADDAGLGQTYLFADSKVMTDAVVCLEILSKAPVGISVNHGWEPQSAPMRVTAAEGNRVISINSIPILEVMTEYAKSTRQTFQLDQPMPFFLHNVLGIETASGHKLRVPMTILSDQSVAFAAEVPEGSLVRIMGIQPGSTKKSVSEAIDSAMAQLGSTPPGLAILFDCVATRFQYGQAYDLELEAVKQKFGPLPYAGLNTFGQLARVDGQFSGFHNSAVVVCVLPN